MNRRYQRQLQLVVVALLLACLALLYLALSIGFYQYARVQDLGVIIERPTPPQPESSIDWRPDIQHCYVDSSIDLWDCIRNDDELRAVMLREDM